MSKKVKRQSSSSSSVSTKKAKYEEKVDQEEENLSPLLTRKELSSQTGLSQFMLVVAMDLLEKHRPLTLIDIVCPSPTIAVLNKDVIEATRNHCVETKKTKKKVYKDDEVRKFIVERREKTLQSEGVRIAGSTMTEKMENSDKDATLVSEFLGYAHTNKGYFVYVYYVGPATVTKSDLANLENWIPVHKTHLGHFHRRIKDHKPYYRHTTIDQVEVANKKDVPLYDPRFMMYKWLAKVGLVHKPLLERHRCLFLDEDEDFLVRHYEKNGALHYYDENKSDCLMIDLTTTTTTTTTMEEEEEAGLRSIFNVEQDRQRQQANGYRVTDSEVCHVTIEEFPLLSRMPLPTEIDLNMEEFLSISQHTYVNEKRLRPPEDFICDPLVMVKAAIMALNLEMQIRRVPPLVGDAKLQILEGDNVKPILDYIGSHVSCTDVIKEATQHSLLAFMATEAMTREPPPHIKAVLESMGQELVLLDS